MYYHGEMYVNWYPISSADGYQVYRSTSKNGKYKKVATVKTEYYCDGNVKSGKIYYYKVRAYKKSGGKTTYSKFSAAKSRRFTTVGNGFKNISIDKSGNVTVSVNKSKNAAWNYYKHSPENMASIVFTQWKNSEEHRNNMLNAKYTYFATAIALDKYDTGMYKYSASSIQLFLYSLK